MTDLYFYNGLREIGGTFVVVETEHARCMFDFGFAVSGRLDSKMKFREGDYVNDYIRLGVLPRIDGIYDEKVAKKADLKPFGMDDKKCFFLISHMHIDHMGGLGCLDDDLPVYMSTNSLKLYRRLAANGEAEHKEHTNCIGIDFGCEFSVEDITVKVVALDHDVIGACGFIITTNDGSICYTGDYRFHGFHPEWSREFGKTAHGVDVLITEGVTVSHQDVDMLSLTEPEIKDRTEYALMDEISEKAKESGLIIVNPYNRNVERMHNMISAVNKSGRTLLFDPVEADYVSTFFPEDEIYIYEPLYKAAKVKKELPDSWHLITLDDVLANPDKYVIQVDYQDMYELLDFENIDVKYLHVDGAPLGDYDPSFAKMKEFLSALDIEYNYMSLGGHAKPYYLRTMIDTIAPKVLVPLHSFRPEQVCSEKAGERILPKYGSHYRLANSTMKEME